MGITYKTPTDLIQNPTPAKAGVTFTDPGGNRISYQTAGTATQPAAMKPATTTTTPPAPTTTTPPKETAADILARFRATPDTPKSSGGGGSSSGGSASTGIAFAGTGLPVATQAEAATTPAAEATPSAKQQALDRMNALTRPEYVDSYADRIAQMEANPYADYESKYIPQMDALMERLQNRQFRYAQSEDPLYRQYAARYQQQARQGMQDTMGQAAALTGGYGSSYATTAAQQAYANTMNGMNDKALELYQLAKDRYDTEGSEMRANLSAMGQMEDRNRTMYDSDRAEYHQRLNDLRAGQQTEYQRWADQLAQYNTDYNNAWNQYAYWEDLAEKQRQFDQDLAYKYYAARLKSTV